jgi:hypothetical protein
LGWNNRLTGLILTPPHEIKKKYQKMRAINSGVSVGIKVCYFRKKGHLYTVSTALISTSCIFTARIFNEIVISECPSRAAMFKSVSAEGICVEAAARNGNCQIFNEYSFIPVAVPLAASFPHH